MVPFYLLLLGLWKVILDQKYTAACILVTCINLYNNILALQACMIQYNITTSGLHVMQQSIHKSFTCFITMCSQVVREITCQTQSSNNEITTLQVLYIHVTRLLQSNDRHKFLYGQLTGVVW